MDERRKVQRFRVLKAGVIAFNCTSDISCRVRNLSTAGACLEVESQFGVPEKFVLLIDNDHLRQRCHVIWRIRERLGVEFGA